MSTAENIMMAEFDEELRQEEGFRILDDAGAMWAIRKRKEAAEECEYWVAWYQQKIDEVKAKRDATIARMDGYLRDYAETLPMKETKTQRSYALPGAKLVYKKATTKLEHDDAAILRAVKEQGRTEYVKMVTVEKLDWTRVKDDWKETGEMFDGMEIVEVPESFKVEEG